MLAGGWLAPGAAQLGAQAWVGNSADVPHHPSLSPSWKPSQKATPAPWAKAANVRDKSAIFSGTAEFLPFV